MVNFEEKEVKEERPEKVKLDEEEKQEIVEKEFTKEEKEKNRGEFLDKETENFGDVVKEEDDYIKLNETRQDQGLIKKEYANEQIEHSEKVKKLFKQVREKAKLDINFKIEEFLKHYSPEERQNRMAENKEKIEKLKPDLEDLYKKGITKQKIEDIEEENRILEAIKDGKF